VLNARSISDSPATYTYCDKGASIIDQAWVSTKSCHLVNDFMVHDLAISDQLPCVISLNLQKNISPQPMLAFVPKVICKPDKLTQFSSIMESSTAPNSIDDLKNNIILCCSEADLLARPTAFSKHYKNKPWFNHDCVLARDSLRRAYQLFSEDPSDPNLMKLKGKRKQYSSLVKSTKRLFAEQTQVILSECHNSGIFWKKINKFRPKRINSCPIDSTRWESFYDSVMPAPDYDQPIDLFPNSTNTRLDEPFSMDELLCCLKRCPSRKAPGPDIIPNFLIKGLPSHTLHCILNFSTPSI